MPDREGGAGILAGRSSDRPRRPASEQSERAQLGAPPEGVCGRSRTPAPTDRRRDLKRTKGGYRPCNSSAMREPSYIFRSASGIAIECTLTVRPTAVEKMNRFETPSMFESNTSPTTSAFLLITGLPEFPPMMSLVDTKLYGVDKSRFAFRSTQRRGSLNGSLSSNAADRSYRP